MIKRTILKQIEESVSSRPITLITGARQVGKSTLALLFEKKGFSYVSLDDYNEKNLAINDPKLFLSIHPCPLIIDEVQKAPQLFEAIEEVVNKEKKLNGYNYGMFILTGSQIYKLMKGISESLSGRVSIIHMSPLSRNEILNREETAFNFNYMYINERAKQNPLNHKNLFKLIIKGFYPEPHDNNNLKINKFYSDYVETYIERDVSEIINIKNKLLFRQFMELLGSLTGEELVYDHIANIIGVDKKTIISWISVLLAGDIIYLLQPYNENSISKRIVKRPKLYFSDTGLACYLSKLNDADVLQNSQFSGRFVETYIINEIRKSFLNNGLDANFYYYRDNNMNEIDLIILREGKLHRVECKSGITYNNSAVKGFKQLDETKYQIGEKVIICNTENVYAIKDNVIVLPLAGI